MENYLITGGAGFIGSNFIKFLLNKYEDIRIICLDKLTYAGNKINIKHELDQYPEKLIFIKGDICDRELIEDIFNKWEINYLVNFAAESHVDRSIKDSNEFIKTNIKGVQNLLDVLKDLKFSGSKKRFRFLQISTDEVYGSLNKNEEKFTEKSPLKPNNPYAASKASAELLVHSYHKTYGLPTIISRCSNNYGPYQFPEKLIPVMINNILKAKKLPVYGDGKNVRDWIHVKDHCEALDIILKNGEIGEIYNVGSNNERTNIALVKELIKETKDLLVKEKKNDFNLEKINQNLIKFVKDRLGHDKRYSLCIKKIKDKLNWRPSIIFEQGLRNTIKWYINNRNWLKSVKGD